MAKTHYNTRQMNEILAYLRSSGKRHVSVSDIQGHFLSKGIPIGVSTIYRNLERLVTSGIVAKYTIDERTSACYEYFGEGTSEKPTVSFHLKCVACGKLIHLECSDLDNVYDHILESHDFLVERNRTVIYGYCGGCRKPCDCKDGQEC